MNQDNYQESKWFQAMDHSMRDLVHVSFELLIREEALGEEVFHDYSFVVFPLAKAYEGFLKKVFVERGFINQNDFLSKHFRVGKSMNPDMPKRYRREDWVYGLLEEWCQARGNDELPMEMWEAWRKGRNLLFHFWPNHENFISLVEARARVETMVMVMEKMVESELVEEAGERLIGGQGGGTVTDGISAGIAGS